MYPLGYISLTWGSMPMIHLVGNHGLDGTYVHIRGDSYPRSQKYQSVNQRSLLGSLLGKQIGCLLRRQMGQQAVACVTMDSSYLVSGVLLRDWFRSRVTVNGTLTIPLPGGACSPP